MHLGDQGYALIPILEAFARYNGEGVDQEILIALPAVIDPVSAVRSTLIQSSLVTLKKRGHFEHYCRLVEPAFKAILLESLAPEWLSLDAASAHYRACDGLGLGATELLQIGQDVGERIQGTFVGTLVRRARTVGLTPWVVLNQTQRLWARLMTGGAVGLVRTGPKDCTADFRRLALCQYEYFRAAFCGVISSGVQLGAGKSATVRVGNCGNYAARCLFNCSWV